MEGVGRQPYTRLSQGQVKPVCVVLADPAKAFQVAQTCEKFSELANNGAYRSFNITWNGIELTLCSHGHGSASAALCFEELIKLGALCILRIGTCGSLQPKEISQGDVVLVNAAVREEGVSALMVPPGYPAVADPFVFEALRSTAKEGKHQAPKLRMGGITLTSDLFYKSPSLPSTMDTFAKAKVDVVEMETATLFVIAKVRGIRSGAVLTVDGSPLKTDVMVSDPNGEKVAAGKTAAIQIVLDAAVKIASE